jgi:hypothetical protein
MPIPEHACSSNLASDLAWEINAGSPEPRGFECDHCGKSFEGEPGGAGLLVWTRGEEVRLEEPPLCEDCASSITIGALLKWNAEAEEEG